jgi:hypothetical protein
LTLPGDDAMCNERKTGQARGGLRLVAGQGTDESPRQGNLHAVGTGHTPGEEPPALSGAAAGGTHVLTVSLPGATPPVWRRLEVPSAITLDHLHQVLQEAFGWSGTGAGTATSCRPTSWSRRSGPPSPALPETVGRVDSGSPTACMLRRRTDARDRGDGT